MSKKLCCISNSKNRLFLLTIIIINFLNLFPNSKCLGESQVAQLASDIKRNELGSLFFETLKLNDEISFGKNTIFLEKYLKRFREIIEYKDMEYNSYFKTMYNKEYDNCQKESMDLQNKNKSLKNILSNINREKQLYLSKINDQNSNLSIIAFLKNHFHLKNEIYKKLQKEFFLNKYLMLPILEDLIDFSKMIKTKVFLIKRNVQLSNSNSNMNQNLLIDFLREENFNKINNLLNLFDINNLNHFIDLMQKNNIEQENRKDFITNNYQKFKDSGIFQDLTKKCILYNIEPKSALFIKDYNFILNDLKNSNQQFKKIIYCSENIILLKHFSINTFLKNYKNDTENLRRIENIVKLLNLLISKFEKKIKFINDQFDYISHNVFGSNSYLENQVGLLENNEESIKKEISLLEEESSQIKSHDQLIKESEYFQNIISIKDQICENTNSEIDFYKIDSELLLNIQRVQSIISFEPATIDFLFEKNKKIDKYGDQVPNEKESSFLEFNQHQSTENSFTKNITNTFKDEKQIPEGFGIGLNSVSISLLERKVEDIKNSDIDDVDFDAI